MAAPEDSATSPPRAQRRKSVTPEYLLRVLNKRLEGYGHCHNCHFAGPIRRLDEPKADGRNWSRFVALVCTSGVAPGCARAAERILDDASKEYNVKETA